MALYVETRPGNPLVGSQETFNLAKSWISNCLQEHDKCPGKPDIVGSALPRRVLDTSPGTVPDQVRLYESLGEKAQYVALSYVWGTGKTQYTTTKETMDDNKNGINMDKLSKTIQDAIHCTRQLGVQYLWVDTLCIIQDSLEDKAEEIRKMSSIYKNALVTISAAKAASCDEGFLGPRPELETLDRSSFALPMTIPIKTSDGKLDHRAGVVWLARQRGSTNLETPDLSKEPISRRAWTLQESWLSPRLLIYGSGSLGWICASATGTDGGIWKPDIQFLSHGRHTLFEKDHVISKSDQQDIAIWWEKILLNYTSRQLGVSADKFNALDGIAEEFGRLFDDECIAGLWKNDLVRWLGWYQSTALNWGESIDLPNSRACPSWSWAKVDGPVHHDRGRSFGVTVQSCELSHASLTESLGLYVRGHVTLNAPVIYLTREDVVLNFSIWSEPSKPTAFMNIIYPDGGNSNSDFNEAGLNVPEELLFLQLGSGSSGRQNLCAESRGLVLVPVHDDVFENTFRRTGFYSATLADAPDLEEGNQAFAILSVEETEIVPTAFGEWWAGNQEMQTVTIV
jgi:hypothetical protein